MTSITLDQAVISQLTAPLTVVTITDASGRVVGEFTPRLSTIAELQCPLSEEELDEIAADPRPGPPLEDILRDLEKLQ